MTSADGAFHSAQDADSEGAEGKYYTFVPHEIKELLGKKEGREFNAAYDITIEGNYEGRNIPNLLKTEEFAPQAAKYREKVYEYRRSRYLLHKDDKILTSWNALMIAAMCQLYQVSGDRGYRDIAVKAQNYVDANMCTDEDTLYISCRDGKRGGKGLLDEYAYEIYALLSLYDSTLSCLYLDKALALWQKVFVGYWDDERHGFRMSSDENEKLIMNTKQTYDGALPSGNSVMTYDMFRLYMLTGDNGVSIALDKQIKYMCHVAAGYPMGCSMFLNALADNMQPPVQIKVVLGNETGRAGVSGNGSSGNVLEELTTCAPLGSLIRVLDSDNCEYKLVDNKTTFYVCKGNNCIPPFTSLEAIRRL